MNIITFFSKSYGFFYNRIGLSPFFLSLPRFLIRKTANLLLPKSKTIKNKNNVKINAIVSLTSFPKRFSNLWLVIESIKNQSYLPKKIILWLSQEELNNIKLPQSLQDEIDTNFEIRLVPANFKSHNKYYYAFKFFPNETIITLDDDILYHPDTLKYLWDKSKENPNTIITNKAHEIIFDQNGPLPYNQWMSATDLDEYHNPLQLGYTGVLYPPNIMPSLTLNNDIFMSICPMADDLWLNAMARFNNIPIIKSDFKYILLELQSKEAPKLSTQNVGFNKNDEQLNKIRKYLKQNHNKDPYLK